ncbi:MAG: FprA family A-type flavoprotein [Acholeplasmataceae bacterium]|nr:FprA family A-type flavoprotein [Acholeplasmataceae bacterium]
MKQALKIKENVYWVGAIDWNLRDFHGYQTNRGGTYNAYLIVDETITLIDNVYQPLTDEIIERISSVIDPSTIDVIISNHGEPDHSGSIEEMLRRAPNAKVYASAPAGLKSLSGLHPGIVVHPVKTGDTLSIGKRTLTFIQTPLVHWPDNMVTYDAYDKILFSNDMFGQHVASFERYDNEMSLDMLLEETKTYYANIMQPYGPSVKKALAQIKPLAIEMIATSHGVIWKDHIGDVMGLYETLSTGERQNKAVVIYDTMWGSTEKMAIAIAEAFASKGIKTIIRHLGNNPLSEIVTDVMDATYIAVGSPTLNTEMLPSVSGFLTYLKGLVPKGLSYVAFGSYGWGQKGPKNVDLVMEEMGHVRLIPLETHLYRPTTFDLDILANKIKDAL